VHIDRDEMDAVRALVADDYLTQAEADQIVRESAEYVAWARAQNAKAAGCCKRCSLQMREEDRGQWVKSLCGSCETDRVCSAVANLRRSA
jgi:hypothetical protein